MLYYIVPPVIIIVSLAILITFIFKKFSKEGNIDQSVIDSMRNENPADSISKKFFAFISNMWLKFLERIMQKMKLFSLKTHNMSNDLFHSIRSKREKNASVIIESKEEEENVAQEEMIVKKEVDVARKPIESVEGKNKFFSMKKPSIEKFSSVGGNLYKKSRFFMKKNEEVEIQKEKEKIVEKVELEEDLIKRIAINPKDIEAYERLGDYYSDLNNFRDAIECYKQVLKLSPNNGKVVEKMNNLELLLKK